MLLLLHMTMVVVCRDQGYNNCNTNANDTSGYRYVPPGHFRGDVEVDDEPKGV